MPSTTENTTAMSTKDNQHLCSEISTCESTGEKHDSDRQPGKYDGNWLRGGLIPVPVNPYENHLHILSIDMIDVNTLLFNIMNTDTAINYMLYIKKESDWWRDREHERNNFIQLYEMLKNCILNLPNESIFTYTIQEQKETINFKMNMKKATTSGSTISRWLQRHHIELTSSWLSNSDRTSESLKHTLEFRALRDRYNLCHATCSNLDLELNLELHISDDAHDSIMADLRSSKISGTSSPEYNLEDTYDYEDVVCWGGTGETLFNIYL